MNDINVSYFLKKGHIHRRQKTKKKQNKKDNFNSMFSANKSSNKILTILLETILQAFMSGVSNICCCIAKEQQNSEPKTIYWKLSDGTF